LTSAELTGYCVMKVIGAANNKWFIASAGWHDCVSFDGMMRDGGIPGTDQYAGYTRGSGKSCWAEIPITFADFYNDYLSGGERKYGVWKIEDVRILSQDEIPNIESEEWILKNALWGTRGVNGEQPLKYIHLWDAEEDHLIKIRDEYPKMEEKVNRILELRNK